MSASLEWQLKLDKKRGYTLIAFLDDFLQHHSLNSQQKRIELMWALRRELAVCTDAMLVEESMAKALIARSPYSSSRD